MRERADKALQIVAVIGLIALLVGINLVFGVAL